MKTKIKSKNKVTLNPLYKENIYALYAAIITDMTVSKALSAMGVSEVDRKGN